MKSRFSEHLQLDPDLTLEKAKKMIRPQEAVYQQQEGTGSDSKANLGEVI